MQLALPPLGLGTAALGNLYRPVDQSAAVDAVMAAIDEGIGLIDTAPYYGFGLSEERVGAALRQRRPSPGKVVLSTKVGRLLRPIDAGQASGTRLGFVDAAPFEPYFDYSYDGVLRSFEQSRARLGCDHIEILLAHDLGRLVHGSDHEARYREFIEGGYLAMRRLRDEGSVTAIGLGVNEWEICSQALGDADFDLFLLAGRYTLLEQTPLDGFLPLCARRQVRVLVGGPYNSGILATGSKAPRTAHFDYLPAPPEILERVRRIEAVCAEFGVELAAAALQFPLAHPQIAAVVAGMDGRRQVAESLRLAGQVIPSAFWSALRDAGLLRPDAPTPEGKRPADE